jgi:hypothetical protein
VTGKVTGFNGVSSNQSFSNVYSSNITASNATFSNMTTASSNIAAAFIGDGSQLTNIPFGFRCFVINGNTNSAFNTTWTVPAGVNWIKITGTGGGGAGGGTGNTTANGTVGGTGGASGGTQIWRGYVTPGTMFTIVVGGGGYVSNFGGSTTVTYNGTTYISAAGGNNGQPGPGNGYSWASGNPNTNGPSLAQISISGCTGHVAYVGATSIDLGGTAGGSSVWGSGGAGGFHPNNGGNNTGYSGLVPGSGGGGARYNTNGIGGNGAPGIVVIEY